MSRLRLAVVGAGHLGRFHARVAAKLPDARLVAVVDTQQAARDALAAEVGAQSLASVQELIGLADAAILATPTTSHNDVARELLLGGIHVLVEKPITTTLSEADELIQLAKRQQLVLQVGHIERFNPAFTAVQNRLADPKYITARRLSPYSFRSTDVGVVHDLNDSRHRYGFELGEISTQTRRCPGNFSDGQLGRHGGSSFAFCLGLCR